VKPTRAIAPWLLLGPALAVFAAAVLVPLVLTGGYSLTDWNGFGPMTWVGLDNYTRALNDPVFIDSFVHVLTYIAATLVLEVLVGL
jgi:raffinose/stachyose/melibiose transport system permease protein